LPIAVYRYKSADNSLARITSRYTYFDGRLIRFILDSLYINSINIHSIMIINKIYEKTKLSVDVACFLPGRAKDL